MSVLLRQLLSVSWFNHGHIFIETVTYSFRSTLPGFIFTASFSLRLFPTCCIDLCKQMFPHKNTGFATFLHRENMIQHLMDKTQCGKTSLSLGPYILIYHLHKSNITVSTERKYTLRNWPGTQKLGGQNRVSQSLKSWEENISAQI